MARSLGTRGKWEKCWDRSGGQGSFQDSARTQHPSSGLGSIVPIGLQPKDPLPFPLQRSNRLPATGVEVGSSQPPGADEGSGILSPNPSHVDAPRRGGTQCCQSLRLLGYRFSASLTAALRLSHLGSAQPVAACSSAFLASKMLLLTSPPVLPGPDGFPAL